MAKFILHKEGTLDLGKESFVNLEQVCLIEFYKSNGNEYIHLHFSNDKIPPVILNKSLNEAKEILDWIKENGFDI